MNNEFKYKIIFNYEIMPKSTAKNDSLAHH